MLLAYVLGAVPFGYLLVKLTTGSDVRSSGSGNIGATNVLRTAGRAAGVVTLLLDIGKGYLAVWLASRLTQGSALWMSAAALAVMAGHAFPVFLKFKGGKAVASCVGAFLCLTPCLWPQPWWSLWSRWPSPGISHWARSLRRDPCLWPSG